MPARIEFATSADNSDSPTTRMTILSGGNVGIGTTAPLSKLHIENTSGNDGIRIINGNAGEGFVIFGDVADTNIGSIAYNHASNAMTFDANNAERMRIDSSGNLLVGHGTYSTAVDNGSTGVTLGADGRLTASRANTVARFNREDSNGTIVDFLKDGAVVGNIGVASNNRLYFAGGNSSLVVLSNEVYPGNSSGAASNNTVALGSTGARFKDLFIGNDIGHLDNGGNARLLYDKSSNLLGNTGTNVTGATVTSSGQIKVTGSNASTVAFSVGDAGTGFFNTGSNSIGLSTGGSEKLRMESSGNLSLGTTAPMQDFGDGRTTLALKGTGSQDYAVIQMGNKGTASNNQLHGQIAFYDVHSGSDLRVSRISSYREISTNSSYLTFGTSPGSAGTTDQMRLDRAGNLIIGNVGIWSTTGNVTLIESNGTINTGKSAVTSQRHNGFYNANGEVGSIRTLNSATSYNTSSDYRLKENVVGLTGATDRVKALKPSRFNFISEPDATVDGFLAHEAQAVVPEAVHGTKDAMVDEEYEVTPAVLDENGTETTPAVMGTRSVPDMQGIDQSKLVPLLTAALQEALTRIETLEAAVTALQGE